MSRSKHQKGRKIGWDCHSRRGDMGWSMFNSFNRRRTIKRERRIFKEADRLEINMIGSGSGE